MALRNSSEKDGSLKKYAGRHLPKGNQKSQHRVEESNMCDLPGCLCTSVAKAGFWKQARPRKTKTQSGTEKLEENGAGTVTTSCSDSAFCPIHIKPGRDSIN